MKPVETFRQGQVVASVWQNNVNKGSFRTASLNKNYKAKDGEWKSVNSYGVKDIKDAMSVLDKALVYLEGKHNGS